MNYEEAVAYIEDIPRFTTKNSLDHTRECLRRLGDPQRKFRVIHVAGTNGKGSTCAFITSVLREAGYSCGLFTSPHLDRHLPEQFRPLVEKARELLPVPEVQQPEREQERGHTWGGMEL